MVRTANGLIPATDHDRELMQKSYPIGQPMRTECKKRTVRSLQHHRLYFAGLIGLVKEYWEPDVRLTNIVEENTASLFCKYLQCKGIALTDEQSNVLQADFLKNLSIRRAINHVPLEPSNEDIHEWIKIKAGYFDLVPCPDNTIVCKPKSISFAKMDQVKFDKFFKKAVGVCWKHILSKQFATPQELENAANRILEMAQLTRPAQVGHLINWNNKMAEYIVILESDSPPKILLGQNIFGAVVTELKQKKQELVSAAYLANLYSISTDTVRRKLEGINQGSEGKFLYNPALAATLLKEGDKNKRGRKRANQLALNPAYRQYHLHADYNKY